MFVVHMFCDHCRDSVAGMLHHTSNKLVVKLKVTNSDTDPLQKHKSSVVTYSQHKLSCYSYLRLEYWLIIRFSCVTVSSQHLLSLTLKDFTYPSVSRCWGELPHVWKQ